MTDCPAVVSIQLATARDALDGHLAWGELIGPDLVVVPAPLDWLDAGAPLEVLLVSAAVRGPGLVERIKPAEITTFGLEANPAVATAAVRLAHPSRHMPAGGTVDTAALEARLATDPDLWTALESLGGVRRGIRDLPKVEVLGPVVQWETEIRRGLVKTTVYRLPHEIIINWCLFSPRCGCTGPWW